MTARERDLTANSENRKQVDVITGTDGHGRTPVVNRNCGEVAEWSKAGELQRALYGAICIGRFESSPSPPSSSLKGTFRTAARGKFHWAMSHGARGGVFWGKSPTRGRLYVEEGGGKGNGI